MAEEFDTTVVDEAPATDEGGGFDYTPEELAMFPRIDGAENVAEGGDDVEVSAEEDPWGWAKDYDPDKVRKTWEKFTDEWGKVAEMEKEFEPYKQLAEEIQSDPALQAHLRKYFEQGRTPENELMELKSQFESLQRDMTVKEELSELREYVGGDEKLPKFDERELIEYAAKNGAPSLRAAYRDMYFDEIRNTERDATLDEVKRMKGAAVPKVGTGSKVSTKLTQKEIDNMSDEEMIRRYGEVAEFYGGKS